MLGRHCHLLTTYVNISILFSNPHGQIFSRNIPVATLLKMCAIELDLNTNDTSYKSTKILRCWLRLYLQFFLGRLTFYLRYLCLLSLSGIQHILCCVVCICRVVSNTYCVVLFVYVEWYPTHIVLCCLYM